MKPFHFPDFKTIDYTLNIEIGRYQKTPSKFSFQRLPFELKIEKSQNSFLIEQGAETILTGRFVNNKRQFFTGLKNTKFQNWYQGDNFEIIKGIKIRSLIIFNFQNDYNQLIVYYINRYYKDSPIDREIFVNKFISTIE